MQRRKFLAAGAAGLLLPLLERSLGGQEDAAAALRERLTPALKAIYDLQQKKVRFRPGISAAEFVKLALEDLDSIEPQRQQFIRYVAIQNDVKLGIEQVTHLMNSVISRSAIKFAAVPVAGGKLARIELDMLVIENADTEAKVEKIAAKLTDLVNDYEQLATKDTFFSTSFAPTVIRSIDSLLKGSSIEVQFDDKQWRAAVFVSVSGQNVEVKIVSTGKTLTCNRKFVRVTAVEGQANFLPGAHTGDAALFLRQKTGSSIPIMELREWVVNVNSTTNDGLYYRLANIDRVTPEEKLADPKLTDLDKWLKKFGSSVQLVRELDADSKCFVKKSRVTHRNRIVAMFYGIGTKPGIGPTLITLTFDVSADAFNEDKDPLRNLGDFDDRTKKRFRAIEAIAIRSNGYLEYSLYDNDLNLVTSVPDDVTYDEEAPEGSDTRRIFSGMACQWCHDKKPADPNIATNSGWQTLRNDALKMKSRPSDIIADRSLTSHQREDIKALVSKYGLDPSSAINLARVTYSKANFEVTHLETWQVVEAMRNSWNEYKNRDVTPAIACRDLGFEVEEADAALFLQQLLPAVDTPENLVIGGQEVRGVREDGAVTWLMQNESVMPDQWRLIRKHAMLRVFVFGQKN